MKQGLGQTSATLCNIQRRYISPFRVHCKCIAKVLCCDWTLFMLSQYLHALSRVVLESNGEQIKKSWQGHKVYAKKILRPLYSWHSCEHLNPGPLKCSNIFDLRVFVPLTFCRSTWWVRSENPNAKYQHSKKSSSYWSLTLSLSCKVQAWGRIAR